MRILTLLCATLLALPSVYADSANIGAPAPNFTLPGADGKSHSLSDYAGKYVVLEWTNPQCPFVKKFYGSNTMQAFQKKETGQGVIWLRINSGAIGHEGSQTAEELASYVKENHVAATQSLIDSTGKVGHMYGARNTPQMFVIAPTGKLIYAGGIDNKPSADPADIATATNYVTAALDEARAGKQVTTATAQPYGCSVKYADE